MLPGHYVKHDGGVDFQLCWLHTGELQFEHREQHGGALKRQLARVAPDSAAFTISWEWGSPTFVLACDKRKLLENGQEEFVLQTTEMISEEQIRSFKCMGVLCLHDAVPISLVSRALESRDVKQAILKGQASAPGHWCEIQTTCSTVLDLLVPTWSSVCKLLGDDTAFPTCAQVAVKSPGGTATPPGHLGEDAHIDGLHSLGNGVPEGELRNFTMLIGIALSDVPMPNMGNFAFVPCSHQALARALPDNDAVRGLSTAGGSGFRDTLRLDYGLDLTSLAPPLALCCRAGTTYFSHYSTVHFVQPNALGTMSRVAVYFRVTGPARRNSLLACPEALTREGLWLEYPGVQALCG